MGLWKDSQIEPLQNYRFYKKAGISAGIQLAHAGRKASTTPPWTGGKILNSAEGGWIPQAPSAIPFREGGLVPAAMSTTNILQLRKDFLSAAGRALEAGFEVVEIHGAHGYLINSFLSPLSNHRQDEYGGSFENRTRLLKEIVSDIRTVWPEKFPLFLRISATDYAAGGWDIDASVQIAKELKELGIDLIDSSSGGLVLNVNILWLRVTGTFAENPKRIGDHDRCGRSTTCHTGK
jgi:2,4-dienoyl-CoA reductase-like NADH-dependent reductase (Old Yellow Enzyme family)